MMKFYCRFHFQIYFMNKNDFNLANELEKISQMDKTEKEIFLKKLDQAIDSLVENDPEKATFFAKNIIPQLQEEIGKLQAQVQNNELRP